MQIESTCEVRKMDFACRYGDQIICIIMMSELILSDFVGSKV